MCPACKGGRVDIRGEHQGCYRGRGGLIMRHDCIRDLLRQELNNAGFTVEIEQNSGCGDKTN